VTSPLIFLAGRMAEGESADGDQATNSLLASWILFSNCCVLPLLGLRLALSGRRTLTLAFGVLRGKDRRSSGVGHLAASRSS
jgi:hypothetical protein